MAITDIQISEELETNAPSIKYSGNEGPKSPEEEMMMADALLKEEYEKYVYDLLEIRPEATPMSFEEFKQMVIAEGQMSGGQPLPQDPTKPVNPFQPKPQGPVLPNRQMAAYGGIMGLDGRKKYGIGSWFQENIMDPIKENPEIAATAAALAGYDLFGREDPDASILRQGGNYVKDLLYGKKVDAGDDGIVGTEDDIITGTGILNKKRGGTQDKDDGTYTYGGKILETIGKNIVPAAGGIMAGLFTKNTESDTPGLPSDNTAMNIQNLTKTANLLDQKQGLAAGMNFLPAVSARKYTPEEMAITYANAANGGRIGYQDAGPVVDEQTTQMILDMNNRGMDVETISTITQQNANTVNAILSAQNKKAEGGIMDLGGLEKDYRAEGGFVPIGKEEKADDVPARLSVNEFVFTADAVRNAGGGDIDQGAKVMENMMKHLEAGGQVSEESQGMAGARDMFATSQRLGDVV